MIASGIMGCVIYFVLALTEGLGMWCVLFAMAAAIPTYAIALTAVGGLTRKDLENVPFVGRRVLAIGEHFGMFKEGK